MRPPASSLLALLLLAAGGCGGGSADPWECPGCWLLGTCVAAGAENPDEPCQLCDPARSISAWSPRAGACDDGLFCNGADRCQDGACAAHTGDPCGGDGDGAGAFCAGVACDEEADACVAGDEPCPDDGLFCTGVEYCAAGCQQSGDPCAAAGEVCFEDEDACCAPDAARACTDDGASVLATDSCGHVTEEACPPAEAHGECFDGACGCQPSWSGADCSVACVIRVRPDGDDARDGSTWALAMRTVQAAIDRGAAAPNGCQIWLAAGTYLPTRSWLGETAPLEPRRLSFTLRDRVELYGGFLGHEASPAERFDRTSTLSGDLGEAGVGGDNALHVVGAVRAITGVTRARLDHILVTGGQADEVGLLEPDGGGLYADGAWIELVDCTFEDNVAHRGGAVAVRDGALVLEDVAMVGNLAAESGGAIYLEGSTFAARGGSTLHNNGSLHDGGALYVTGAPSVLDLGVLSFTSNFAWLGQGAALYVSDTPGVILGRAFFRWNSAPDGSVWFLDGVPIVDP